jgi:rubrerythrin
MENRTELGMNRTGIQVAPVQSKRMMEVTEITRPSSQGDENAMAEIRAEYIRGAEPVGTVPVPLSVKGAVTASAKILTGKRPQVFMDKLGERLAFERTGTRLYQAFIMKCRAPHGGPDVVSLDKLLHIQEEELRHFKLLTDCMTQLGGDPTAQTPCADVAGVESMGLLQVVTDPKTTINQSLHAILVAELSDNVAWEELIVLAREMGLADMATRFEEAAAHERDHLETVRTWHEEGMLADARLTAH